MERYFDESQSAAYVYGQDTAAVIRLLASRYMGANPAAPFTWRTWQQEGIQCDRQAAYHFDFDRRFPIGAPGETAWAAGDLYCPQPKSSNFILRCYGPVRLWLNGEEIFVSGGNQERSHEPCRIHVTLKGGFNRFVLRCERTTIGFGCSLQNAMPQWEPCNYVLPFDQYQGAAGFLYTRPSHDAPCMDALWAQDASATGLTWMPEAAGQKHSDDIFWGWASFRLNSRQKITWQSEGVQLWIDGLAEQNQTLAAGVHQLLMHGKLDALWHVSAPGVTLQPPVPVKGPCSPFLILPGNESADPADIARLGRLHGGEVWQTALEGTLLRPFAENALFGRWTYPLGVTLYGMHSAASLLGDQAMDTYVHQHVDQVTAIQDYALWETKRFGFAGVNQQLCWLDALDDCGSFGSLMLECTHDEVTPDVRRIADTIGHYMLHEQVRTAEGAFCRRDDTIWVDDMYMSVPFLCRYADLMHRPEALDECACQLLHYRDLQLMPDKGVMAHMRCLRHNEKNDIPWSRGNGWVIFSLSELLPRLPEDHPLRGELIDFFVTLTEGYLALQDEDGLWHQILDEHDTYQESSATAMFICAFTRGVRFGWYKEVLARRALDAAVRAWDGLTRKTIDRHGNLYGVCQGSGFSFSRAYYRTLNWNFNDTHGTGIVMLAGTELMMTRP